MTIVIAFCAGLCGEVRLPAHMSPIACAMGREPLAVAQAWAADQPRPTTILRVRCWRDGEGEA